MTQPPSPVTQNQPGDDFTRLSKADASELLHYKTQLEAVERISQALFQSIDLDELVETTLRIALEEVGAEAIVQRQETRGSLQARIIHDGSSGNAAAARDKREERDSRDALALFYLVVLFPQVSPVPLGLIDQPTAKEIQCSL